MTDVKAYCAKLIEYQSISPSDVGCQHYLAEQLARLGFSISHLKSGPVDNLWARFGNSRPLFVFAGHTDVVQAGQEDSWQSPPFKLTAKDDRLVGRGVADMKGAIAAMLVACERLIAEKSPINGSIGFLITSGEEGDEFMHGTPKLLEALAAKGEHIDWCVVGEPTASKQVGDTIKVGRRGSITARLTINGQQGHVAYPHLADNAAHKLGKVIAALADHHWDNGNEHFPATTLQITQCHAGVGANNVIPGQASVSFNLRFSTELNAEHIKQQVATILLDCGVNDTPSWQLNGKPFLTKEGQLLIYSQQAIKSVTGLQPELSTSGGTSDGRFIAEYCQEVIELGLTNKSIHQVNESIHQDELTQLSAIYQQLLSSLLRRA